MSEHKSDKHRKSLAEILEILDDSIVDGFEDIDTSPAAVNRETFKQMREAFGEPAEDNTDLYKDAPEYFGDFKLPTKMYAQVLDSNNHMWTYNSETDMWRCFHHSGYLSTRMFILHGKPKAVISEGIDQWWLLQ